MSSDDRIKMSEGHRVDWSQVASPWTTIAANSKPQPIATPTASELLRILDNLERLNQQVYSLSKTVETLTTENEYLKDMMNEEFRSKNEE